MARAWRWLQLRLASLPQPGINGVVDAELTPRIRNTRLSKPRPSSLTRYIDAHPNGNRLLVSISGDEITLITHVPAICDDFGTQDLPEKLRRLPAGLVRHVERLRSRHARGHPYPLLDRAGGGFRAFDDPERNQLVLFKLHPLPNGQVRDPEAQRLNQVLPEDKIYIPIQ